MNGEIRKRTLARERISFSKYAMLCDNTKGRLVPEEECPVRTAYQRDRDRIIHCSAFRRLKDKTQVFLAPGNVHYRTRLTHTLEVSQIARTIARSLALNEDLTEAIALGHDLGHTPFGHAGERALNQVYEKGFTHFEQSLRVVDMLESGGKGLNLTYEVRDGIVHVTVGSVEHPMTKEHYIEWICLETEHGIQFAHLDPDDKPKAKFALCEGDEVRVVYAFCNQHDLWKN